MFEKVSLFFSCFRYFYVFINFIGDIKFFLIIVKRYWIALEIALYKFIIIIIFIKEIEKCQVSLIKILNAHTLGFHPQI